MTDVSPTVKPPVTGQVDLYADTELFGAPVVHLHGRSHMLIDGDALTSPPTGDHSFKDRTHHPRHATLASASSAHQYHAAVRRAARSVTVRTRLPLTQEKFYAQRTAQRR